MDLLDCLEDSVSLSSMAFMVPQDDVHDILATLFARERAAARPASDYMVRVQTLGMKALWRAQVCDWMTSMAAAVDFEATTVALAIHYLDRYLSAVAIRQSELELVALVCVMTASKFHEKDSLTVAEVAQMIDDKYTPAAILALERQVLQVLQWKLHAILPSHFINAYVALLPTDIVDAVADLCADLLPTVTKDLSSLEFYPSEVGYTVFCAALEQLNLVAAIPTYAGESTRLNECDEVVEAIFEANIASKRGRRLSIDTSAPVAAAPSKQRPRSPSNVEDFFEEEAAARSIQRRRLSSSP
ncbi:Aste57867_11754 [Aphanomyces stellatus]|uniref:Aste57867_11754 protein n=1 Tax=Aphanomyces stellatus TaxID=120398 RepID=A0A485KV04_9STRA|nr:hypothetical protein As57867_011709 [Aphanomyces stellatus]VFT88610.1 Aste57867_11754 [Aphanomyces stellatus]